jgi:hypothetical protein
LCRTEAEGDGRRHDRSPLLYGHVYEKAMKTFPIRWSARIATDCTFLPRKSSQNSRTVCGGLACLQPPYVIYIRSYWIPGSYAPALSEKWNSFLRLLKNKSFKKERMTKVGLYVIGKSTTLESNKSLSWTYPTPRLPPGRVRLADDSETRR